MIPQTMRPRGVVLYPFASHGSTNTRNPHNPFVTKAVQVLMHFPKGTMAGMITPAG